MNALVSLALAAGLAAAAAAEDGFDLSGINPVAPVPEYHGVLVPWAGWASAAMGETRDALGLSARSLAGGFTAGADAGWRPVPAVQVLLRAGWRSAGAVTRTSHDVFDADLGGGNTLHEDLDRRDTVAAFAVPVMVGARYVQTVQDAVEISVAGFAGGGYGRLDLGYDDVTTVTGGGVFAGTPSSYARGTVPFSGGGAAAEALFGVAWKLGDRLALGVEGGYLYFRVASMTVSRSVDLDGDGVADARAGDAFMDADRHAIPVDFSGGSITARLAIGLGGGSRGASEATPPELPQAPEAPPPPFPPAGATAGGGPGAAGRAVIPAGPAPEPLFALTPWLGYGTASFAAVNATWGPDLDDRAAAYRGAGYTVDRATSGKLAGGVMAGVEAVRRVAPGWYAGVRLGFLSAGTSPYRFKAERTQDFGGGNTLQESLSEDDALSAFAIPLLAGARWTPVVRGNVGFSLGLFAGPAYGRLTYDLDDAYDDTGTGAYAWLTSSSHTKGAIPYAGYGLAVEALAGVSWRAGDRLTIGLDVGYHALTIGQVTLATATDLNGDGVPDTKVGTVLKDAKDDPLPLEFSGLTADVRATVSY